MPRNPSEDTYGNSQFRELPTFGSSGIRVVHTTPETSVRPPAFQRKNPTMSPMGPMKYQETHKRPMAGKRAIPPTGEADSDYLGVLDSLEADESEPITGEERFFAEVYARDEWGESETNVF